MYKVFFGKVPIFFTQTNVFLSNFIVINVVDFSFDEVCQQILGNPKLKINVVCHDLEQNWASFLMNFDIRKAAGGVVANQQEELLWIYRFGKWDLPKGHIENGESKEKAAIREVQEECNVTGLNIKKELQTTYHIFNHNGADVLKITYWFLMSTETEDQYLLPQLEEGITKVCFKDNSASLNCLSNTYDNIQLLLKDIVK